MPASKASLLRSHLPLAPPIFPLLLFLLSCAGALPHASLALCAKFNHVPEKSGGISASRPIASRSRRRCARSVGGSSLWLSHHANCRWSHRLPSFPESRRSFACGWPAHCFFAPLPKRSAAPKCLRGRSARTSGWTMSHSRHRLYGPMVIAVCSTSAPMARPARNFVGRSLLSDSAPRCPSFTILENPNTCRKGLCPACSRLCRANVEYAIPIPFDRG